MAFALFFYFIFPFGEIRFGAERNPEFSVGNISTEMQFYKNMRFSNPEISYKIENNCSLEKKNKMKRAFDYMTNLTILNFYPVNGNEEITVSCEEKTKPSGNGFFVAGEGGPTKIIAGDNFYVIFKGEILLLRDSKCENPNIEIHELLHVLGFNHSQNKNNIMYPVSDCSQTIGNEIPEKLNELYSFPSYPDLKIGNVSADILGRYLNINLSVENIGLKDSQSERIIIYADGEKIKETKLDGIKIGEQLGVQITNIFVMKIKIENLKIIVETDSNELSLENNQITLTRLPD